MPTHARIDLDHWIREIPLASLRAPGRERLLQNIYGPADLAYFEQLRAERDPRVFGRGVPTDVCIWSLGEPENAAATKIGGRPYRPTDAPWPTAEDGSPMGLLAQFNFLDSLDVLDPRVRAALPGDVLLVFTAGPHMYADWDADDPDSFSLEWHRVDPDATIPPALYVHKLTPTFAALHRTMDYPDAQRVGNLNLAWGTKFGGVHPYLQPDPELPGTTLCTLASLNPFGNPWPLLNVPVNPKGEQYLDKNLLMMGDLGSAYFNLDDQGRVHWSADCG